MSGGILQSAGRAAFQLAYETSPIWLSGGLATQLGIGISLPVSALLLGLNTQSPGPVFYPLPGSTLNETDVATWPFANQATAGNATVSNVLHVSMMMICPVSGPGGWTLKLATFVALKATLDMHTAMGGTFTVLTPAYPYSNCILRRLVDVSPGGEGKQVQQMYQWDFEMPLITLSAAAAAMNTFMSKITNGLPNDGTLSGANVAGGVQGVPSGPLVPGQAIGT